jgi:DNA repair exonuclease SbcCD ATPase subunit
MKINDILEKVLKGETLSDDEKKFLADYDADKAAKDVRAELERKLKVSEDKAKSFSDKLKVSEDKLKELEEAVSKAHGANATINALQKKVDDLIKQNADAEAKEKARARMDAIKAKAAEKGVLPLDGFSEKTFDSILDLAIGDVDISNATALEAAIESFKTENAVIIKAPRGTSTSIKGIPSKSLLSGPNPFKKDTFNLTKQIELISENPAEAKRLAAEAGVPIE